VEDKDNVILEENEEDPEDTVVPLEKTETEEENLTENSDTLSPKTSVEKLTIDKETVNDDNSHVVQSQQKAYQSQQKVYQSREFQSQQTLEKISNIFENHQKK